MIKQWVKNIIWWWWNIHIGYLLLLFNLMSKWIVKSILVKELQEGSVIKNQNPNFFLLEPTSLLLLAERNVQAGICSIKKNNFELDSPMMCKLLILLQNYKTLWFIGHAGTWLVIGEVSIINHFFRFSGLFWSFFLCPFALYHGKVVRGLFHLRVQELKHILGQGVIFSLPEV